MSVVKLDNVSVSYYLPRGAIGAVKGVVKNSTKGLGARFLREISALKSINLEFKEGQRIGLVGLNGSGKSTLLKTVSGALAPSEGEIEVHGEIASVLSLGGGLNKSLSGRRNAVLKYYNAKSPRISLDEFLALTEEECNLGSYFEMPVSTYSAGMQSRLNRAMLKLIKGEIYLFDEWVVLGDQASTDKGAVGGDQLKEAKLVMLASHSESLLREWTTELIWLHEGRIKEFGEIDSVLKNYQDYVKDIKRKAAE